MDAVEAALQCPVCHKSLQSPTTLHCGHSVCSKHRKCICDAVVPLDSKLDITLSKVLALTERTIQLLDEQDHLDYLTHIHNQNETRARFKKELIVELTCEICFVLLFEPLTTPCQHTFCSRCLHRSLDHNPHCPLCRSVLPGFAFFQDHPKNQTILSLLLNSDPEIAQSYKARREAIEAEERDARLDTPIFVCQLSFPGMPTLLHFFEPRYRLMLRRCLESQNPSFGMIMPPRPGSNTTVEYGTMLQIRSVQMLNDGRSMVETWGAFRFRILERGVLDGYMVGRIERIDDFPDDPEETETSDAELDERNKGEAENLASSNPSGPSPSTSSTPLEGSSSAISRPVRNSRPKPPAPPPLTTQDLVAQCFTFLNTLHTGTPWISQRLSHTYGYGVYGPYGAQFIRDPDGNVIIPLQSSTGESQVENSSNPPSFDISGFSFWVGAVLPIDDWEKAKLLPVRSVKMRLQMCLWWIEGFRRQWWFHNGCVIL